MRILLTQDTSTTPGPSATMDCPSCKTAGAVGKTAEVEERNTFFFFIPFFTARWVTVSCGACGKKFGSSNNTDELAAMSRQELSESLANWQATHVDFLVKFCVVISLVLGVIPYLGLLFGLIAVAFTFKRKSGWKTAAFIGLALGLLSSVALTVLLVMGRHMS